MRLLAVQRNSILAQDLFTSSAAAMRLLQCAVVAGLGVLANPAAPTAQSQEKQFSVETASPSNGSSIAPLPATEDSQIQASQRRLAIGETPFAEHQRVPTSLDDSVMPHAVEFHPWWIDSIQRAIRDSAEIRNIDLDMLIVAALQSAPQIRVLSSEPVISETLAREQNARFDPTAFMETKWNDLNDPVGNRLTTGGPPFLEEHIWNGEAGVRKLTPTGARVELAQRLGFHNSNSNFFTPQDQGNARLALNFTQPLLNGGGRTVNRSQIVVARLNQGIVWNDYSRKLQEYLVQVTNAYWTLYYQRCVLLQRYRNYRRALEIYRLLEGRAQYDAVVSQLVSARAAVLARKVEVRSMQTKVLNAETRIRELVRDEQLGELGHSESIELIPTGLPDISRMSEDMESVVARALQNRPEIEQAMQQIKSANVELQVAENDLLPVLSLVMEGYVAGLDGGTGIERAFQQQFGQVKPGYSAGFLMEYPMRNRAAQARYSRRQVQVRKLSSQLDDAVGKVLADVVTAHRELDTAFENFQITIASAQSATADVDFVEQRWRNYAFVENTESSTPNILLEQLLDAQQRQSDAEIAFATAVRNFMTASATLRLAEGTVLELEQVVTRHRYDKGVPQIDVFSTR